MQADKDKIVALESENKVLIEKYKRLENEYRLYRIQTSKEPKLLVERINILTRESNAQKIEIKRLTKDNS